MVTGDSRLQLQWNPSWGAQTYTVKRAMSIAGPFDVIVSGLAETSYIDAQVVNGQFYWYLVTASNSYGESGSSHSVMARPTPPPAPPTDLTATSLEGWAKLSWNPSEWAERYHVFRSSGGSPYELLDTTYDATHLDYTVHAGTTYSYVVKAVNHTGESEFSSPAEVTPAHPLAPTGLTATAGVAQVTLSWNPVLGVTYYILRRSVAREGPYDELPMGLQTRFVDTGLTGGATYYHTVTAANNVGESAPSGQVSATPEAPPPPAPPTKLTATAGKKRITLKWVASATPGVEEYRIYRGVGSGGPYSTIDTIPPDTAYTDFSVRPGVKYFYVVTAVKLNQESEPSNVASAKVR